MSTRLGGGTRAASLILLLGLAVALLGLAVYLPLRANATLAGAPCPNPPSRIGQFPHPELIVLFCLASFWLGRLAGHLREAGDIRYGRRIGAGREWLAALVQGLLTAFLLVVVVLLAFETFALATNIWPITFYVRCANDNAALPSIGGACIVCLLIGHWLWYPARGED